MVADIDIDGAKDAAEEIEAVTIRKALPLLWNKWELYGEIRQYYILALKLAYKWINRRSQKEGYNYFYKNYRRKF